MKAVADKLLEQDKYEIELYLSTDGKHTVHYTAESPTGRKKGLIAAMTLFDAIKAKYGTKADMWGGMMNGKQKASKPAVEPVKTKDCPECGGTMGFVEGVSKKTGKKFAMWKCQANGDHIEWINLSKK